MGDEACQFGIGIDHQGLSEALGLPVLPVSAKLNEGIAELMDQLHQWGESSQPSVGPLPGTDQLESPALEVWQQELGSRSVALPEGLLHRRTCLVDRLLLQSAGSCRRCWGRSA